MAMPDKDIELKEQDVFIDNIFNLKILFLFLAFCIPAHIALNVV